MKYISILALILTLSVCTTQKTVKEEPFTVDFNSPKISAGTFTAQFDKLINIAGLRQVEVKVDYLPLEDAVCLQYRIDFMTYYLYWDRDGRAAYVSALKQYNEDFEQRALSTKGSRTTRRKYGKVGSYLIWQASAYTVRMRANTDIDLGYDVKTISKNKAPFFTLYQRETFYTDEMSKNERRTASNMSMYLTRAKADELAEFFDQEFLAALIPERGVRPRNEAIIPDAY
jgi:hypothetical protein